MKAGRPWGWAGRRQVWLRLIQARLWDSDRGAWLAPRPYRSRFARLSRALVVMREPLTPDDAARELDDLFRVLAVSDRDQRERGHEPPPDVEWSHQDAARWLLDAKAAAERQVPRRGGRNR